MKFIKFAVIGVALILAGVVTFVVKANHVEDTKTEKETTVEVVTTETKTEVTTEKALITEEKTEVTTEKTTDVVVATTEVKVTETKTTEAKTATATTAATKPAKTPKTTVIHHEATGHWVHTVTKEAWVEDVVTTETIVVPKQVMHPVMNAYPYLDMYGWTEVERGEYRAVNIDAIIAGTMCDPGCWHSVWVASTTETETRTVTTTKKVNHPEEATDVWVEDTPAWDETVTN